MMEYYSRPEKYHSQNREKLCYSQAVSAFRSAHFLYLKAQRKAKWRRFICCLFRRNYTLPALSQVLKVNHFQIISRVGIQPVALNCITGSESRSQDFDRRFQPLNEKNRERWMRIAGICLTGQSLPAVDLIQVGSTYFVRDGHHRVSVMRALGYHFVDANVTVWQMAENNKECCAIF